MFLQYWGKNAEHRDTDTKERQSAIWEINEAVTIVRFGNRDGDRGIGEYFFWNSGFTGNTIDARSCHQNSRRALVIVPPVNLQYSCIF